METSAAIAPVPVAIYASERDPQPHVEVLTWADLASLLTTDVPQTPCAPCPGKHCPHKFGMAWSPVDLEPGAARSNAAVRRVTAAVLDLDHLSQPQVESLVPDLEGLAYILHTTHSHRPAPTPERPGGDWCLRVVLPLSRPVAARDWQRFHATLTSLFAVPVDPAPKDLSRLYFLPTVSEGGAFMEDVGEGVPVDVDAILGRTTASIAAPNLPGKQAVQPVVEALSAPPEAAPVDLGALREMLRELRTSYRRRKDEGRATIIDNALNGTALVPEGKGQATALHTFACMCATKFPSGTPADAFSEVVRASVVAMGAGTEGLEYWHRKAADSYERAMAERVERDRRAAETNARLKKGLAGIAQARSTTGGAETTEKQVVPGDVGGVSHDDPDEDAAWAHRLRVRPAKDENSLPGLVKCALNAELLLTYSDEWRGHLRWNDVRREVEVIDLPGKPAPIPPLQRHLDVLPTATMNWLSEHYDLDLSENVVASTLLLVARKNHYDPVREYLDGLVWDGKSRLETFLEDCCGARTVSEGGEDISAHIRRVSAKWLISAAARGLRPGCKVDTVLILESPQGRKKSTLFEVLGGEYHAVARSDVESKDALMVIARSWIVELAELSALKKGDADAAKAFFTTRTDLYRLPYGKAVSEVHRRGVFAGSTNPVGDGYLTDRTGNRRYWTVAVEQIDIARVKRDRDQLFAEAAVRARRALAALDAGEEPAAEDRWWLESGEETDAAEGAANERLTENATSDAFMRAWLNVEPHKRPVEVTVSDVIRDILNVSIDRLNPKLERDVGQALRDAGFTKEPDRAPGRRRGWKWVSTPELRALPHVKLGTPRTQAALVALAGKKAS